MRIALLFKDGMTRPAAAISATIVIKSVRVECTSEGVHTPPKIMQFESCRRSLKAAITHLLCGAVCLSVCPGGCLWEEKLTEEGFVPLFKRETRQSVRCVVMVSNMLPLSIGSEGSCVILLHPSKLNAKVGCFVLCGAS